ERPHRTRGGTGGACAAASPAAGPRARPVRRAGSGGVPERLGSGAMSTPYALAAVHWVLRSQLTAHLGAMEVSSHVGGVKVTTMPPDRLETGLQETNVVNLFLHRVSRNVGWATIGPPPRNSLGDQVATLPLGVDLHYIVSAYGQDPLTAEILLGHAV